VELAARSRRRARRSAPALASAIDFLLEGLYSQKKISRSDVRGYHGAEPAVVRSRSRRARGPDAG
jgi:hypothetical protein